MTHEEMILKAREAKSAEELIIMAKENGLNYTEDEIKEYFNQLHQTTELDDEELTSVSGGGCYTRDDDLLVGIFNECDHFVCMYCNRPFDGDHSHYCKHFGKDIECECINCKHSDGDVDGIVSVRSIFFEGCSYHKKKK